jgi:leader peptidase (prepilin peptidase)/N-methyltransferase
MSYLIVEILTAVVTLLLYKKLGFNLELFFLSSIFYSLIILSFIDFKYKAVPDYLLVLATTLTLIYIFLYATQNFSTFFIFAGGIVIIELFVTYYIQNIKAYLLKDKSLQLQKAMGEGDIPIIAIVGGILGLKFGLIAIFLSAIFAIIPSLVNKVSKQEIETPFIPYLSLGFFLTFIFETQLEQLLEGIM